MRRIAIMIVLLSLGVWSVAQPALPPGLGGETKSESTPALPPGLGGSTKPADAPALPPGLGGAEEETVEEEEEVLAFPLEVHGFAELRGGLRLQNDPAHSKSATLGEARLQLKSEYATASQTD